jgi:hypothetical protein
MTLAQLEQRVQELEEQLGQRVQELEEEVAQMKEQLTRPDESTPRDGDAQSTSGDDEFIEGAEYEIYLDVPPKQEFAVQARIVSVERGPCDLGLSDAEWASLRLQLEEEGE